MMSTTYTKNDDDGQIEIRVSPNENEKPDSMTENLSMGSEDVTIMGRLSRRDSHVSFSNRSLDRSRSGRSRSVSVVSIGRCVRGS
jgi:hypothetical protein